MQCFDVFNGDADGICALVQLRLAEPRKARLITGVKRDINLLKRIDAGVSDHLTVLDISMRSNAEDVRRILRAGACVFYVDHHNPGEIPTHTRLYPVIETRPDICTSLLVDRCLEGRYADWAIVAAFGDNLERVGERLAARTGLGADRAKSFRELGRLINYNAYGRTLRDLHFHPERLFQACLEAGSPDAFVHDQADLYGMLKQGYHDDLARARNVREIAPGVLLLDDAAWARRISGPFGHTLARKNPDRAHAVLTHHQDGGYTVSVRAPLNRPQGADSLCLGFATGGGRAAAAGINHLPEGRLKDFLAAFARLF